MSRKQFNIGDDPVQTLGKIGVDQKCQNSNGEAESRCNKCFPTPPVIAADWPVCTLNILNARIMPLMVLEAQNWPKSYDDAEVSTGGCAAFCWQNARLQFYSSTSRPVRPANTSQDIGQAAPAFCQFAGFVALSQFHIRIKFGQRRLLRPCEYKNSPFHAYIADKQGNTTGGYMTIPPL